jgi:uncharacterized protein (TIGR02099 family)
VSQFVSSSARRTLASLRWCWRFVFWTALVAYFALAATILGLRYWVLPKVPEYRAQIEAMVGKNIGARVTIGDLSAGWSRLHPTLDIAELKVHDNAGNVALSLAKVAVEVSWRSLLIGELGFHSIVLERPELQIRRSADGRVYVAGIEVKSGGKEDGPDIAAWLLRQGEVIISGGGLEWIDEQRGAPPLALSDVNFRLVNRITGEHRFALSATPPAALAAALDVRGGFRGRSLAQPERLRGEVYVNFPYADLAGWKAWIDYPFAVADGRGALRLWASFEDGKITEATGDLALAAVKTQLARNLPVLTLANVEGRLGVRELRKGSGFFGFMTGRSQGYRVYGEHIAFVIDDRLRHEPTSFTLQWERRPAAEASAGAASAAPPDRGEFKATALELAPLVHIAEALPFPERVRRLLEKHDPRGKLVDVAAAWTGDADAPQTYQARARFSGLGFVAYATLPGFTGLSGSVEATQRGGNLTLAGERVQFSYPFALQYLKSTELDTLATQVGWTIQTKEGAPAVEVKVPTLQLASRDFTASATVSWHSLPNSPGFLDLDLRIPRAEPNAIYKYIPALPDDPAIWLRNAFLAGTASDGRVRIRGDLWHFPFHDGKHGTFQVAARANALTLRYAPGWPAFQGVNGDFALNGLAMDIRSSRASLFGIEIKDAHVRSPNLDDGDVTLLVDGLGEGSTPDFFRFLAESPLTDIAEVTGPMKAQGRGRLALKLNLPLKRLHQSQVAGSYEFLGNELAFSPTDPPLAQLAGKLDFTERGVAAKALTAQFLGGPVQFDMTSREGTFTLDAQGGANLAAVRKAYPFPFEEYAEGSTRYTAVVRSGPGTFDLTVDSSLQGVRIDLPAPLGKAANESLPFKLERNLVAAPKGPAQRDQLLVNIGRVVSVQARMRTEGNTSVLDRAGVALGDATAAMPNAAFIAVNGNLRALDLDRLLPVLRKTAEGTGNGRGGPAMGPVTMRIGELTFAGRRINDANLRVQMQTDGWTSTVEAKELAGEIAWREGGAGRITARLKRFVLPELATPEPVTGSTDVLRELPSLDVQADSFKAHGKDFGRLELQALNEAQGWRIKSLSLAAPDGTITANGLWQPPDRGNRTDVNLALESGDAGKLLARMGQPDAVAGGKAKLEGKLAWNGPPTAIHYATLTGDLSFHAEAGRFLKAQPGIGRLLGVLSLQSLPRRASLDFRDVFSDGFSFDDITATATIAKGIMTTRDFRMVGPGAGVGIAGEVDLDKETQNLRVRVVPVVGDSVAAVAALALLNPLVGLGSLIAQRLLKDPIGQLLAYEYAVSGEWSEPKVERTSALKLGADARAQEPQPTQ